MRDIWGGNRGEGFIVISERVISEQSGCAILLSISKEILMTIAELEQAVTQLSEEEFARFREWFEEYEDRLWDEQIERDAKAGKLDKIAEQALNDYRAGKAKEL